MATLKQRMEDDLQLRGLSPRTQKTYIVQVTRFARHFNKLPDKLGEKEVKEYLLYLLNEKHVSYATLAQSYSALKFIYEVTLQRPWAVKRIPLSEDAPQAAGGAQQRRNSSHLLRNDQSETPGHLHDDLFGRTPYQRGPASAPVRHRPCPHDRSREAGERQKGPLLPALKGCPSDAR